MENEQKVYLNNSFTVGVVGERAIELVAKLKDYAIREDVSVPEQFSEKLTKIKINKGFLKDILRMISKQKEDESVLIGFEKDRPIAFELKNMGVKIFVAPMLGGD